MKSLKAYLRDAPHTLILSVGEIITALEVLKAQKSICENDRTVKILTELPDPDFIALKFLGKERRQTAARARRV